MKKLLFTIAIGLVGMTAHAQTDTFPDLPIEHKVTIDSMSKEELYNSFLVWVGRNFNSANNVIQTQNLETGTIIVKFIMSSVPATKIAGCNTHCTMEFNCKDGKYRIVYSNIHYKTDYVDLPYEKYQEYAKGGMGKGQSVRYLTRINEEITLLNNSIDLSLKTKSVAKNNDW